MSTNTLNIYAPKHLLMTDLDANFTQSFLYQLQDVNLHYAIPELCVAIFAIIGNALVILAFCKERKLRRPTNYYLVSLAMADFLVGLLCIPFAILASVGLPSNIHACLFTITFLIGLCTISIFSLVAVSVDRYWAILHPLKHSRNIRTNAPFVIISICWISGIMIGLLPLFGWHKEPSKNGKCFFLDVMDHNFLVFLYFGTIIMPSHLLAIFYGHIYYIILKQFGKIIKMPCHSSTSTEKSRSAGTGSKMLRNYGAARKSEFKAAQNLAVLVLFFMICWMPLYTTNCIIAFYPDLKLNSTLIFCCIILSHVNSAGNPLYAYNLKDFRIALKVFMCRLLCIKVEHQDKINARVKVNTSNIIRHVEIHSEGQTTILLSQCHQCNGSKHNHIESDS